MLNETEEKILISAYDSVAKSWTKWWNDRTANFKARSVAIPLQKGSIERLLTFDQLEHDLQLGYVEYKKESIKFLELLKSFNFTHCENYRFYGYKIGRIESGEMKYYTLFDEELIHKPV